MNILGRSNAIRKALEDGFKFASSIYSHPNAKHSLKTMLKREIENEEEWPHLVKETWRYDRKKALLIGDTDSHALFSRR